MTTCNKPKQLQNKHEANPSSYTLQHSVMKRGGPIYAWCPEVPHGPSLLLEQHES